MDNYDTVTGALKVLKAKGYTIDFNVAFDKIICQKTKICLNPLEFEITETCRFEGATDPGDENVVWLRVATSVILPSVRFPLPLSLFI